MINKQNHNNSKDYNSFQKSTLLFEMLNRLNEINKDFSYLFLDSNNLTDDIKILKNKIETFTEPQHIEELKDFQIRDLFVLIEQNLRMIEHSQPQNIISFSTKKRFIFEDYFPNSFLKFRDKLLHPEEFLSDEDYKTICLEDWGIVGENLDVEILEKLENLITETKTLIKLIVSKPLSLFKKRLKPKQD